MRTQKPISTISYNTPFYLRNQLDELVTSGTISFYSFVCHDGEIRKSGEREQNHIHLYVEPSKNVDTDMLKKKFSELDPNHLDKPLGCMPFRKVESVSDWLLYSLHQSDYIAYKGETKQQVDINLLKVCTNDRATLEAYYDDALDFLDDKLKHDLRYMLKNNFPTPPIALVESGILPVNKFKLYSELHTAKIIHEHAKKANDDLIERTEKYRNLEQSHDMRFDLLDNNVRVVQANFDFENLT